MDGKIAPCIEWEITRKCNLDCRHCCTSGRTARPDELSRAEALRAAGRMAELGCRSVTLSGGEPLLRPDWPDLAASLVLASGISIGCRSGSGRVAANQPVDNNATLDAAQAADTTKDPVEGEGIHAAAEDRVEAQEAAPADQATLWGLPFNASCLCESEEKNDQGEPMDTQPCMCISHMMCPPSSMWICPSGYTRKITSGEEDDGDE